MRSPDEMIMKVIQDSEFAVESIPLFCVNHQGKGQMIAPSHRFVSDPSNQEAKQLTQSCEP
jgi:hypothetical protein